MSLCNFGFLRIYSALATSEASESGGKTGDVQYTGGAEKREDLKVEAGVSTERAQCGLCSFLSHFVFVFV